MSERTRIFRKKDAVPILKCSICSKIQRDSTTITECNHTFCKKCITKKITEDELRSCPICQADLGVNPLEKLRPDHNLQTLAANIFPSSQTNTNASEGEAEEGETSQGEEEEEEPVIRKVRSLSSFDNTPNVLSETLPAGRRRRRRRKSVPNKFPSFVSNDHPVWKVQDCPGTSTSPILSKNARNKKQLNGLQSSKNHVSGKNAGEGKPRNVWDLNCRAETVDTTKNSKPLSKGIVFRTPQSIIPKEKPNFSKGKGKQKECVNISNYINIVVVDDDDDDDEEEEEEEEEEAYKPAPAPPVSVELKKKPRGRPKKSVAPVEPPSPSEGAKVGAQPVVDCNASGRKLQSIWLSLVATYKQDVGPPLPQIPSNYLRIKDVNAPVSFLKKYLVQKLNLHSEDEVDIEMQGLSLLGNMELWYVIDLWSQAVASSEIILPTAGSSAKDFVMALSYSRKESMPA